MSGLKASSQTTARAATPSAPTLSGKVCIPASQARIIRAALGRFERLKPAYASLKQANQTWKEVHALDSLESVSQQKLIGWWENSYAIEQQLRQDADRQVVLWRTKARKRGLLIGVGIGLPAAYGAYRIYRAL